MARSKLVGLLFESWNDMDRVAEGLTPEEAAENYRELTDIQYGRKDDSHGWTVRGGLWRVEGYFRKVFP